MLAKDVSEHDVLLNALSDGDVLHLDRHVVERIDFAINLCHDEISGFLLYLSFLHLLVHVGLLLNQDLVDSSVVSHGLHDFSETDLDVSL